MSADPLSDVLRAVRLTGAVFFYVEAVAPWVAEAPPASRIVSSIMPGAQHLISYHVVTRGHCWGGLLDEPAARLDAGDVIVFPHGDQHVLASEAGMRAAPDLDVYERAPYVQLPLRINDGIAQPADTDVVCGFLGCDARPFNPLLATLPRVIRVSGRSAGPDGWLASFIRVAVDESRQKRSGGECVLARLSELMFVEVVRRHLDGLPQEQTGWLAGLRDPHVGAALGALHDRPGRAWTLDDLARHVGLSRSAFAERFTHFVGQPPMQYLAHWRMQVAAGLLAGGSAKVAAVAQEVGYESEAAFSRAFKKLVGVPPASWRAKQATATARHASSA